MMDSLKVKLTREWEGHAAGEIIELTGDRMWSPGNYGIECEIVPDDVPEPAPSKRKAPAAAAVDEPGQIPTGVTE